MPATEKRLEKSRRFKREMTIHDRETNRIAPTENLADALRKAREFQSSAYEEVRVSGYVAAGQIRAELLRRSKGE